MEVKITTDHTGLRSVMGALDDAEALEAFVGEVREVLGCAEMFVSEAKCFCAGHDGRFVCTRCLTLKDVRALLAKLPPPASPEAD